MYDPSCGRPNRPNVESTYFPAPLGPYACENAGYCLYPAVTMTPGNPPLVWIVDDADSVRDSLKAVLETESFDVRDYASASEFLVAYDGRQHGTLILDHHMPGMSGLELLQVLGGGPGVPPAIVITAKNSPELTQQLLAAGAAHVFDKPVDGTDLIAIIQGFHVSAA